MIKILTLNWNGSLYLESLSKTIDKAFDGLEYKWFIKDNGSKDNSVELVKDIATVYKTNHNRDNYSAGNNILYEYCDPKKEDIIMLLNNDIIFRDSTSIKNMLKILKDDRVGIVGAKLNYNNTKLIQHTGVTFGMKQGGYPWHFRAKEAELDRDRKNREFQAVTGACMMIKPGIYEKIYVNDSGRKGLNENFHWCFDDIDACLRVKYSMGLSVVCCGETNIYHEESASLKKNNINKPYMNKSFGLFNGLWFDIRKVDYDLYAKNDRYNIWK